MKKSIIVFVLVCTIPLGGITAYATEELKASEKVMSVIKKSSPTASNTAKAAPHIQILINGVKKTLNDPIVVENNRVFLPVRNLSELLKVDVEYLANVKIAIVQNENNYLELPLGYNEVVKDKVTILPVDGSNKSTRIFTYNSRTYLPVRFIVENLGYKVSYENNTVSITTDGSDPTDPTGTGNYAKDKYGVVIVDASKMNPSDPFNAENLKAFRGGRQLENLTTLKLSEVVDNGRPSGVDNIAWKQIGELKGKDKVVLVAGKLSDMPKHPTLLYTYGGPSNPHMETLREDWGSRITSIKSNPYTELLEIPDDAKGFFIKFKDGSAGIKNSVDKTWEDISYIRVEMIGGSYILFPTGE